MTAFHVKQASCVLYASVNSVNSKQNTDVKFPRNFHKIKVRGLRD